MAAKKRATEAARTGAEYDPAGVWDLNTIAAHLRKLRAGRRTRSTVAPLPRMMLVTEYARDRKQNERTSKRWLMKLNEPYKDLPATEQILFRRSPRGRWYVNLDALARLLPPTPIQSDVDAIERLADVAERLRRAEHHVDVLMQFARQVDAWLATAAPHLRRLGHLSAAKQVALSIATEVRPAKRPQR